MAPKIMWQNRPAQHRSAVYFCTDDRYMPYTLFLAHQIAAAHPARNFDLCLVTSGPLTAHPLHDDLNIRLCQIDVGALQNAALVGARIGFAAYLRVFMPQIWTADYDRLLYLDGDIFFQRGDIAALLGADLHGAPIGAVLDTKQWHKPHRPARDITALGLPSAPYFNSGVLLIDVAQFNADQVGSQITALIAARGHDLQWHDQTALNAVLGGNWAQMPVQWNYQYSHKTMLLAAQFDVCLFHFIGRRKPFYRAYGGFPAHFVQPYREFLAQHFPLLAGNVQMKVGPAKRLAVKLLIYLLNMTMASGARRMRQQSGPDLAFRPPNQHLP